jgi:hypothetical protein
MNKILNLVVILILFAVFMACFIHTRDYTILVSIPFFVFAILDNFGEKFISKIFFVIAFILFAIRIIAGALQMF